MRAPLLPPAQTNQRTASFDLLHGAVKRSADILDNMAAEEQLPSLAPTRFVFLRKLPKRADSLNEPIRHAAAPYGNVINVSTLPLDSQVITAFFYYVPSAHLPCSSRRRVTNRRNCRSELTSRGKAHGLRLSYPSSEIFPDRHFFSQVFCFHQRGTALVEFESVAAAEAMVAASGGDRPTAPVRIGDRTAHLSYGKVSQAFSPFLRDEIDHRRVQVGPRAMTGVVGARGRTAPLWNATPWRSGECAASASVA
jgi:hypothetical protein